MGGMIPSVFGVAAFAGMRVAGYSAAFVVLRRFSDKPARLPVFVGAKTALGLVVGATAIGVQAAVGATNSQAWVAMLPLRLVAWFALILLLLRPRGGTVHALGLAVSAALWSCVLDGVAWLAFEHVPGFLMPWC